jgi:diaminopimelate epimerase
LDSRAATEYGAAMADQFHKMHGLGNDFVIIDGRSRAVEMSPARAKAISDRKTGIGFDQLIVLGPSDIADFSMRIFNADGGEVEACGNATRAVALLIGGSSTIETQGGLLTGEALEGGARVQLEPPRFDWDAIPLAYPMDTAKMPVGWEDIEAPAAVNVGNPHVIFFVPDADTVDLERLGPVIETDTLFPERVNVNVASVIGADHIKLRVWERGVGITRACGTGACATAVAAIRAGLVKSPVTVSLQGGDLSIEWAPGEPITMTGPATHVFTGETDWNQFG